MIPNFQRRDFIGGLSTFLTMAYIVVLNPTILATPGTGMSFSGVLTATVLLCVSMTLLMGLYAKLPYAVAPGLGINAFFTYTLVLGKGVAWDVALGAVFWSGVLFLLCSTLKIREAIVRAIPQHLRQSLAVGLGIFLTFIGLKNMGLVQADEATMVKIGSITWEVLFALLGLLVMLVLHARKNPLSFLLGIGLITFLAWASGRVALPEQVLSKPDFSSMFFKLDIFGALKLALVPTIVSIFFTDLFDSISTFVGVSLATGLTNDQGEPKNMKQGLIVDAWATLTAGLFGTSSGTAYMESAAGIEVGGRSGGAAIVTALLFVPCFFIAPLVSAIPAYATAPVLVVVGFMMFRSVRLIQLENFEEAFPSFLTIVLIPLSFSITQGILWGFISHVALFVLKGRRAEISLGMYLLFGISLALLILENFA